MFPFGLGLFPVCCPFSSVVTLHTMWRSHHLTGAHLDSGLPPSVCELGWSTGNPHWCACSHRHTCVLGTTLGAHHILRYMLQPKGLPRTNRNGEIKHTLLHKFCPMRLTIHLYMHLCKHGLVFPPIIAQMKALRFREVNWSGVTRSGVGCREPSLPALFSDLCCLGMAGAAYTTEA